MLTVQEPLMAEARRFYPCPLVGSKRGSCVVVGAFAALPTDPSPRTAPLKGEICFWLLLEARKHRVLTFTFSWRKGSLFFSSLLFLSFFLAVLLFVRLLNAVFWMHGDGGWRTMHLRSCLRFFLH